MNKNISSIQYNSLNLPSSITYQNGNMASYVYSAAGGKLSVSYQTGTGNTSTQYCGNIIYDDNNLSQVLIDGGYITFSGTTPQYHYYLQDHLGSYRVVVNESGTAEQINHYYPFGGLMGNSTNGDMQHFKYNGKELDRTHGLDWYDYGARHFDAAIGCWHTTDPLCEKYYSLSPYNYCGGNPIKFVDPNGMDWYKDSDNTYQYDPNINKKSKLKEGQTYIGESFRRNGAWYRNDGSIIFNNETAAYNRMWNQADQHYRKIDSRGREVGGFILKDGKVLVLPDYANDYNTTKIDYYGYITHEDGTVTHGKELFSALAQIHTHQRGSGDPQPSSYPPMKSDLGVSIRMGGKPVIVLGHDNQVHALYFTKNGTYSRFSLDTRTKLLNNGYKIYPWLSKQQF